jgi:hypothetical protein
VPQLASSSASFTHFCALPESGHTSGRPVGQWQLLALQVALLAHVFAHAPQLAGSVVVSMHVLLHTSPLPGGHAQLPPLQTSLVSGQAFPQKPQLAGSFWMSAQNVEQSFAFGAKHPQIPPLQLSPGLAQAWPQVPQFAGSVCALVQSAPQSVGLGSRH